MNFSVIEEFSKIQKTHTITQKYQESYRDISSRRAYVFTEV